MKYALVNNLKSEASKGARGVCPHCSAEMIAKCGEQNINHWAHKGSWSCDPWWETETEWHRSWKDKFPEDWQEVTFVDKRTGEKHIADIHTIHGLTIEFQHSNIKPGERKSRENFYDNLIWVVDGTRLKRDYFRFLKGKEFFRSSGKHIYTLNFPEKYFPKAWLESKVPVIFDFLDIDAMPDENDIDMKFVYCIFPVKFPVSVTIAEISRGTFVRSIIDGQWLERATHYINSLNIEREELLKHLKKAEDYRANFTSNFFMPSKLRLPKKDNKF